MDIIDPTLPSERSEHHKAHGADWYKWLNHLKDEPNARGLELGTWLGQSAEWFLDHILTGDGQSLCTVDTFEGSDEHRLAGLDCSSNHDKALERLKRFGWHVVIWKEQSHEFLIDYVFQSLKDTDGAKHLFDFIYVDAAHDAMNVLRDSVLAFELLKVGGVMIWDDFLWEVMEQEIDRPKLAIDTFLSCYARRIEVIGLGWQVAVRKVA